LWDYALQSQKRFFCDDFGEIKNKIEEKYILLGVGILLIITNKYLAKGCIWWEKEIVRLKDSLNQ